MRCPLVFTTREQGRTDGVQALLAGLEPAALKMANQAQDWAGRLAYQRGRLALLDGQLGRARQQLEEAHRVLSQYKPLSPVTPKIVTVWLHRLRQAEAPT